MKNRILKEIHRYAINTYRKVGVIDMVMGEAPFNRKCHINAVQKVYEGKAVKVFACYAFSDGEPHGCIHFINQLENGKYQDNTWGWVHSISHYYIIREIDPTEYKTIWNILNGLKETLTNLHSTRLQRWMFRINAHDLI